MGKRVISIQSRFDKSCFDMNSSSEIAQKFHSLQDKFAIELEKHFGQILFLSQVHETIYISKELSCIETTLYRNDHKLLMDLISTYL